MQWSGKQERVWQEQYAQALQYFKDHGSLSVPPNYIAPNGKRLGVWITKQQGAKKNGKLSKEQLRQLEQIGL